MELPGSVRRPAPRIFARTENLQIRLNRTLARTYGHGDRLQTHSDLYTVRMPSLTDLQLIHGWITERGRRGADLFD